MLHSGCMRIKDTEALTAGGRNTAVAIGGRAATSQYTVVGRISRALKIKGNAHGIGIGCGIGRSYKKRTSSRIRTQRSSLDAKYINNFCFRLQYYLCIIAVFTKNNYFTLMSLFFL